MNELQEVSKAQRRPCAQRPFARLLNKLLQGLERARTRRLLAGLDGRDLADLGLSHAERLNEMDKPFWR
ncbi:DUF1127 domain-containing protein [Pseudomonas sp. COR58]|uniref:DUF1127 domain-containing protein n=1 Tax=Pseudomonas ekonensis TaxID=2842353 RepID=A0ABS6PKP0_9PSED|nr:DUF1127 domain-containing protein [Pseudomonas ekonensis]MBV4461026.1 DUF1127 domain-containing protein [Pseudomonas ekonensis]